MRGLIRYTTAVDTPQQGIYQMNQPYAADSIPWSDTVLAGQPTEVYLEYYMNYDFSDKSHRSLTRAMSGVVEIISNPKEEIRDVVIPRVALDRTVGKINAFGIYKALNDAANDGAIMAWYPDIDAFPAEFVTCVMRDFKNPKREQKMQRFTFSLRLLLLPDVQAPTTIPVFI